MFHWFQSRPSVEMLYGRIMQQSRCGVFYEDYGVPDTVDGRFDLLVLHAFLIIRRLNGEGRRGKIFGQALFDRMFVDMDRAVREMGVGDLSVPKHVKRMMKAFYGRAQAYEAGLSDDSVLTEALARNLYGTVSSPSREILEGFMGYIHECVRTLEVSDYADICAGRMVFPEPAVPGRAKVA